MAPLLAPLVHVLAASAAVSNCGWPLKCPRPNRTKLCTIGHAIKGDDSPAIQAAFESCKKDAVIVFQEGITYNVLSPVRGWNLSNVEIRINGNIHLPTNIADIQAKVAKGIAAEGPDGKSWFRITGEDVTVYGSQNARWGWFEAYGQQWWDKMIQVNRPRLMTFEVTRGRVSSMKHHAMIAGGWSLIGLNIHVDKHFVDNRPTNGTRDLSVSFPFNTDGINVRATNVLITNYRGYNGDDAVSFIDGANNVTVKDLYAGFSSHGISIGSLGKDGQASQVSNIHVENAVLEGAVYGARFKSWVGGNGFAENVTFRNIKMVNVSTAVFITQNYYDQGLGKRPTASKTSTNIRNFRFENFEGYMNPNYSDGTCISKPCWNYVAGGDSTQSIILDLYPNTAHNIAFKNFNVRPFKKGAKTTVICDPKTFAKKDLDTLGFVCQNGPYIATGR